MPLDFHRGRVTELPCEILAVESERATTRRAPSIDISSEPTFPVLLPAKHPRALVRPLTSLSNASPKLAKLERAATTVCELPWATSTLPTADSREVRPSALTPPCLAAV